MKRKAKSRRRCNYKIEQKRNKLQDATQRECKRVRATAQMKSEELNGISK